MPVAFTYGFPSRPECFGSNYCQTTGVSEHLTTPADNFICVAVSRFRCGENQWQMSPRSARISPALVWRRLARSIAASSARKQEERKQCSRATVGIRPARSEVMRMQRRQVQEIFLLDIRRLPETF